MLIFSKSLMARTVFAMVIFLYAAFHAIAQKTAAVNGTAWHDTNGNFINAHGAGVLFYNGTYYLFGEIKKGDTWRVPNQSWEDYRVPAGGVSCYSLKDLKNWK